MISSIIARLRNLSYIKISIGKMVFAIILLTFLPGVAISSILAFGEITEIQTIIAQNPVPYSESVEYLANKGMSYWFLALAAIAIASWSFIAKWLLQQLESQRATNAELVDKLVGYMEADHAKTLVTIDAVIKMLEAIHLELKRKEPKESDG